MISFRCFFLLARSARGVGVDIAVMSLTVFDGDINVLTGRGMSGVFDVGTYGGAEAVMCQGGRTGPV